MKRFLDILFALTHPAFYLSVSTSTQKQDDLVNEIIDKDLIVEVSQYTAKLTDGSEIWIRNYPYGFGSVYDCSPILDQCLPYRRTRKKLMKHLKEKFGYDHKKAKE